MKRSFTFLLLTSLSACSGGTENNGEAPECVELAGGDFDPQSAWSESGYCDAPTDLGCYPYHESSMDTCGPFSSMRTSATASDDVTDCQTILGIINCGEYSDGGSTSLSFFVEEADAFSVRMLGTYQGQAVDSTLYFNPCQQGCLGGVTLDAFDDGLQKICDIPRNGKPTCMFPTDAHIFSIARVDSTSMEIRTGEGPVALSRAE